MIEIQLKFFAGYPCNSELEVFISFQLQNIYNLRGKDECFCNHVSNSTSKIKNAREIELRNSLLEYKHIVQRLGRRSTDSVRFSVLDTTSELIGLLGSLIYVNFFSGKEKLG